MTEKRLDGSHRSARRRTVGFACAAALVLGTTVGCSDDTPSPEPLEPDTSAASTSPSPTPKPSGAPTLPPQARGTSDKAAIAFVEHVIEVLNYTASSLDTRPLSRLAAPNCAACQTIAQSLNAIKSAGGAVSGGAWSPVESVLLDTPQRGEHEVRVLMRYTAQKVVERSGAEPKRYPAGQSFFTFFIERRGANWHVARIEGSTA